MPESDLGSPGHGNIWQLLYLTSHGRGPLTLGTGHLTALLRCIQQVTKTSKEDVAINKQISQQIYWKVPGPMISYWSDGFLRNCSQIRLNVYRTTMTFQDHMWKLPWQKIVHTMTTYGVNAARLGSHTETLSSRIGLPSCHLFSLGFPDFIFPANGFDTRPGLAKMQKTSTNQIWELHSWIHNTPEVHCWKKALH